MCFHTRGLSAIRYMFSFSCYICGVDLIYILHAYSAVFKTCFQCVNLLTFITAYT